MRVALLTIVLAGCNGLFEDNPEFFETEGSAATAEEACDPDAYEPNDEQALRTSLPPLVVGGGGDEISAVLEGPGAVDWYVYEGVQSGPNPRRPKVTVDAEGLLVCAYVSCVDGSTSVECGSNELAMSPDGSPGCCGLLDVILAHDCDGVDGGDVMIDVRISDAMDRGQCLPYTMDYSFL